VIQQEDTTVVERSSMFTTLIVEDNAPFRHFLTKLLHERFPAMVIAEAEGGEEVRRKLHTLVPDLIFMDIELSGENGLDLTKQIKMGYHKTIVIILTSYDLPEYRKAAAQSGASYFFSKDSVSVEEIVKVVKYIIGDHDREADCPTK
jgi:DNA-binding NarL/FixJ family response regulator